MGIFDVFKKKSQPRNQDAAKQFDQGLMGLAKGGYVDYELDTYRVAKKSLYDEEGDSSYEWHLIGDKSNKHLYLGYEKEDGKEAWFVTEACPVTILGTLKGFKDDDAPKRLKVDATEYALCSSGASHYFQDAERRSDPEEMIYWFYQDNDEEKILTVEQWGEDHFEVFLGKWVDDTDFYNIIQGSL